MTWTGKTADLLLGVRQNGGWIWWPKAIDQDQIVVVGSGLSG